jgi:CRP/FNR family cyclic AMP-dependent transcriptional regulator
VLHLPQRLGTRWKRPPAVRHGQANHNRIPHPATQVKIFEVASQEEFTEQARECVESIGEDLVDQLFNSSEKRLARILFLLAHSGKESWAETVHPRNNQENLAQRVGSTRLRISHFMKKFKKLGFVDYSGGLPVHSGLLSVALHN